MGYKFSIEYKTGASNKVADALSRRDADVSLFATYARPLPTLLDTLRDENSSLSDLRDLHAAVRAGTAPPHVTVTDGCLYFKTRLYVSRHSAVRVPILEECHASPTAGHPGEKRTFARAATTFYWPDMRRDVRRFVAACFVCQTTKYSRDKPNGLLQPLPIPDNVWDAASMDFIVGLPPSHGYSAIMVVVDRLSKYAHFGALKAGFDGPAVARLFVETIVKLHGFPARLLSDRDPIFMSEFWNELLSLSGTKLQFTTAYHPQTDGQSEVTNRSLEQYLRSFVHDCPHRWFPLLPWAELALNCSTNASIGMSPYQALYGREPPNLFQTPPRVSNNATVAGILEERELLLRNLKQRLSHAQQLMVAAANRHRKDITFHVGDKVLLRLQPYRQSSVAKPQSTKLGPRFYGPYDVLERIGRVAYRLRLPQDSKIHDVFHVSLLRPYIPSSDSSAALPPTVRRNQPLDTPVRASASRVVLINRVPQEQWLIHWTSARPTPPTWELAETMRAHFPHLHLEGKVSPMGGRDDTGLTTNQPTSSDRAQHAASPNDPSPLAEDPKETPNLDRERPIRKRSQPTKFQDYIPY